MDQEDIDFFTNMNKKRIDNQFWMDRRGKIYKYTGDMTKEIVSFHTEIASQIYPDAKYADDVLYNLGWVLVGSNFFPSVRIKKKPTQAQLKKLEALNKLRFLYFEYQGNYASYEKYGILCE